MRKCTARVPLREVLLEHTNAKIQSPQKSGRSLPKQEENPENSDEEWNNNPKDQTTKKPESDAKKQPER